MTTEPDPGAEDHTVFDAAPDGILLVDSDGTIVRANPQALRDFGYESGELEGMSVESLVPASVRGVHRAHRGAYLDNPHTRPMGSGLELEGVRKNGSHIPVEISLSPLRSRDGSMVIAIVRDLTERRRLRGFGAAALNAAEEERQRIARELHDETAQELAAVLMNLTVLEKAIGDHPLGPEIEALRGRVTHIVEGVRRIARGLRPPELEDVGLAAALHSFVRTRFPADPVRIDLDGSESALSAQHALAVYRIAQEGLTNAVKHGQASQIRLSLRADGAQKGIRDVEEDDPGAVRGIILEIGDDGSGFRREQLPDAGSGAGLGLVGMEERAQIAGGRLEIDSNPGEGTTVRAWIPTEG